MSMWFTLLAVLSGAPGLLAQTEPIQVSKGATTPPGAAAAAKTALPRDGIAARVNNEIITWKDVDDSLKGVKAADLSDELRLSKLRKMAEERLFLQAAKQNNLTITEPELDEYLRREIKRFGSEEEFEKILRVNNLTKTEFREEKRKEYLVLKLYRHLMQKAFTNPDDKSPGLLIDTASPEEMREYYEAHRDEFKAVENITVWRVGLQYGTDRERELKMRVAESFLRRLEKGADFYIAAAYYSDVRQMSEADRSPVYGHRGLTRADAAQFYSAETVTYLFDTIKEDEVSPIRDDGRTLNIFKLAQRVKQKEEMFEDAQFRIRSILENRKREDNRRVLRAHLMKSAYLWPADLFDPAK